MHHLSWFAPLALSCVTLASSDSSMKDTDPPLEARQAERKSTLRAVAYAHEPWKMLKNPREGQRQRKKEGERELPDSPGKRAS